MIGLIFGLIFVFSPFHPINAQKDGICPPILDIILLFDTSGGNDTIFEQQKNWTNEIIKELPIHEDAVRIGLIQYSDEAKTEFNLSRFSERSDISSYINQMSFLRGDTKSGIALTKADEDIFNFDEGARVNANRIVIIFTDGLSMDNPTKAAKVLRRKGVKIFSISVNSIGFVPEMLAIVADVNNIYGPNDEDRLQERLLEEVERSRNCDTPPKKSEKTTSSFTTKITESPLDVSEEIMKEENENSVVAEKYDHDEVREILSQSFENDSLNTTIDQVLESNQDPELSPILANTMSSGNETDVDFEEQDIPPEEFSNEEIRQGLTTTVISLIANVTIIDAETTPSFEPENVTAMESTTSQTTTPALVNVTVDAKKEEIVKKRISLSEDDNSSIIKDAGNSNSTFEEKNNSTDVMDTTTLSVSITELTEQTPGNTSNTAEPITIIPSATPSATTSTTPKPTTTTTKKTHVTITTTTKEDKPTKEIKNKTKKALTKSSFSTRVTSQPVKNTEVSWTPTGITPKRFTTTTRAITTRKLTPTNRLNIWASATAFPTLLNMEKSVTLPVDKNHDLKQKKKIRRIIKRRRNISPTLDSEKAAEAEIDFKPTTLLRNFERTTTRPEIIEENEEIVSSGVQCPMDILFVVDSSGSIGNTYDVQKNFLTSLIKKVEPTRSHRVGLIQFAGPHLQKMEWSFDTHSKNSQLLSAIRSVRHLTGTTYIGAALELSLILLDSRRKHTETTVILVSDGFSQDDSSQQAKLLRQLPNVKMYAISLNNLTNTKYLTDIVGDRKNLFIKEESKWFEDFFTKKLRCIPTRR